MVSGENYKNAFMRRGQETQNKSANGFMATPVTELK